jgi:hypothetical protein
VDDLVQVWVPKRFLADVYALVARLEAEYSKTEAEEIAAAGAEGDSKQHRMTEKEWTPELIRRMYEESPFGMLRVLNYMADNPDRWISSPELHEAIEPGRTSRRSPFGPFGRRVKNRYGMNTWPIEAKWDYQDGHMMYMMDGEIAEQIRNYRKEV